MNSYDKRTLTFNTMRIIYTSTHPEKCQKTLSPDFDNYIIATSGMSKAHDIFLIYITIPSIVIESKTYIIIILLRIELCN